ncbi:EamA family transporter RarD [Labedella populi]|uniref:EamA family transporter RarD n=1 Tax=Labedella populi TaxID=2498850 RepID=A0A444QDL8_9MICO|nr:EamA family transporter RarD [Labedella populi]RWZ64751.1 EamA family transporter RarD [Labedella populi]
MGSSGGLAYAASAYVLWGLLPLFFLALVPAGPIEVVAWRIVFSLVFCLALLTVTRSWSRLGAVLRDGRTMAVMVVASLLIFVNWQTYVLGALTGHVVDAALGYFINPIFTVVIGVVLLRERLRRAQWLAVGIALVAVVVLAVGYGDIPWIALILATSFSLYGYIKKRVGGSVDALSGLTIESFSLIPLAIVGLVIVSLTTGVTFGAAGPWHVLLIVLSGVITAVPLLFFAAASRRLPLVTMGLVQFLAPVLQFIVGVVVQQEAMPVERWIGFALVWFALVVLVLDLVMATRASRSPGAVSR